MGFAGGRLSFEQDLRVDVGSRSPHSGNMGDQFVDLAPVGHGMTLLNLQVGLGSDEPLAELQIKPGHHRQHDDQYRNAEHHPGDTDQGDDRDKGALGPQITQRERQFIRHGQHPWGNPSAWSSERGGI